MVRINQISDEWHLVAVGFRRDNDIRNGDRERSIEQLCRGNKERRMSAKR